MNKYILVILLIAVSSMSGVHAQSFKYEKLRIKHLLPAKTPFSSEFKTISVRFDGESYMRKYGQNPSTVLKEDFSFNKYENVKEHGDLLLQVVVDRPQFLGVEHTTKQKKVDDKSYTYHSYKATIITPIYYKLYDGARNLIEEEVVFDAVDHKHYLTEEYKSKIALEKAWYESKNVLISKFIADALETSIKQTSSTVRDRYDDVIHDKTYSVFNIKKAEKIGAQFLNEAFTKWQENLAVNPVITDWGESERNKLQDLYRKGLDFDYKDKKERIVYTISSNNLAVLLSLWGKQEEALTILRKGKLAGRKEYELNQLEKKLLQYSDRGSESEISTKSYVAAYEEGADDKIAPSENNDNKDLNINAGDTKKELPVDTVILVGGEKLVGQVKMIVQNFNNKDAVPFVSEVRVTPKGQNSRDFKPESIQEIKHNQNTLYPIATPVASYIGEKHYFYKLHKTSKDEKVYLFKWVYHPSMPNKMNNGDNIFVVVQKEGGKNGGPKVLSVSLGLKFALGINKGLKKAFSDCFKIVEEAEAKKYKSNEASFIKLIDDYDACH